MNKPNKHITLILFLIFVGLNCVAQTTTVDSLFKEFRTDVVEQERKSNRVHMNDKTELKYYSFIYEASIEELVNYMNDSSAAIRCLVFSGLVGKDANRETLVDIANAYNSDTTEVRFMSTDVVIGWTVSEYIQRFLKFSTENAQSKINYSSRIERIKAQRIVVINGANYYDEIKKDALSELDSIYCYHEEMKIISFNLFVGNQLYESEGNSLTNEMKSALKQIKLNDKVYIENIQVLIPDNTKRKLASIELEIK